MDHTYNKGDKVVCVDANNPGLAPGAEYEIERVNTGTPQGHVQHRPEDRVDQFCR